MRHRLHIVKFGRPCGHRHSMMANLVCSLIEAEQISTTLSKAKETRRFFERMVTYAKKADLAHRRLAIAKLKKKSAVKKLFDELAPALAGRNGGYTRILKLGKRVGDAAETCLLQVIRDEAAPAPEKAAKAEKKTSKKKEVKAE